MKNDSEILAALMRNFPQSMRSITVYCRRVNGLDYYVNQTDLPVSLGDYFGHSRVTEIMHYANGDCAILD